MPVMSAVESTFCRSAPWRGVARKVVLPWALGGRALVGDVLEIGGGSGAMAEGVARSYPGVRLTVTDLDESMVRSASERLAPYPRVSAEAADGTALPHPDASFDVVTSYLMLHHVVDWRPAVAEAARVLRPGGLFAGYDLTDTTLSRLVHRVDGSPVRMVKPADLREALSAEGLVDVEVDEAFRSYVMRFRARKP